MPNKLQYVRTNLIYPIVHSQHHDATKEKNELLPSVTKGHIRLAAEFGVHILTKISPH